MNILSYIYWAYLNWDINVNMPWGEVPLTSFPAELLTALRTIWPLPLSTAKSTRLWVSEPSEQTQLSGEHHRLSVIQHRKFSGVTSSPCMWDFLSSRFKIREAFILINYSLTNKMGEGKPTLYSSTENTIIILLISFPVQGAQGTSVVCREQFRKPQFVRRGEKGSTFFREVSHFPMTAFSQVFSHHHSWQK